MDDALLGGPSMCKLEGQGISAELARVTRGREKGEKQKGSECMNFHFCKDDENRTV